MTLRMRTVCTFSVTAILTAAVLSGCAATEARFGKDDWYKKGKEVSTKAVEKTKTVATSTYDRMQKYLKEKDLLQTFHDAGEHSQEAVLDILHKAGIKGSKPPPPSPGPKKPVPQQAPLQVPEQYAGKYRWPLDAGVISSDFGARWGKMHEGIDIAADMNEPVYAVAAGQVIYAGNGLRGYGNVVIIRHDSKVTSLYAHNSELKVKVHDTVQQGDLIALLGSTGHSTGPHVHFEFREGDVAVNPNTLLPKSEIQRTAKNLNDAGRTAPN